MDARARIESVEGPGAAGSPVRVAWRAAASWPGLPLALSGAAHLAILAAAAFVVARQGRPADEPPIPIGFETRETAVELTPELSRFAPAPFVPAAADLFSEPVEEVEGDAALLAPAAEVPPVPSAAPTFRLRPPAPVREPDAAQEATVPPDPGPAFSPPAPVGRGNRPPRYPGLARRLGLEGTSLLDVLVLADGSVGGVEIVRTSGHRVLDEAAAAAVRRWRFTPARRGGVSTRARVLLPVTFRIVDEGREARVGARSPAG